MSDQLVLAGDPAVGPWRARTKFWGLLLYETLSRKANIQTPILQIANNEMIVALLKKASAVQSFLHELLEMSP